RARLAVAGLGADVVAEAAVRSAAAVRVVAGGVRSGAGLGPDPARPGALAVATDAGGADLVAHRQQPRAAPAARSARRQHAGAAFGTLESAASAPGGGNQPAHLFLPAVRAGAVPQRVVVCAAADPARMAAAIADRAGARRHAGDPHRVGAGRRRRGLSGDERDRTALRRLRARLQGTALLAVALLCFGAWTPPAQAQATAEVHAAAVDKPASVSLDALFGARAEAPEPGLAQAAARA